MSLPSPRSVAEPRVQRIRLRSRELWMDSMLSAELEGRRSCSSNDKSSGDSGSEGLGVAESREAAADLKEKQNNSHEGADTIGRSVMEAAAVEAAAAKEAAAAAKEAAAAAKDAAAALQAAAVAAKEAAAAVAESRKNSVEYREDFQPPAGGNNELNRMQSIRRRSREGWQAITRSTIRSRFDLKR